MADKAEDSTLLRTREMDLARQLPERSNLADGTAELRPVTNWVEKSLGWDGFMLGEEGGKEGMAGKKGNSS